MEQKPFTPAASEVVALLKKVVNGGHAVLLPADVDPALPLIASCCLLFGLSHAEGRGFVHLLEHEHASKKSLHAATSTPAAASTPAAVNNSIGVLVHKLRRKLQPHGIEIATVRSLGFRLTKPNRDRAYQLLAEYGAERTTQPPAD